MARVHLWEWEDLPWVPDFIRRFITDHLRFLAQVMGLFQPLMPQLVAALRASGATRIVDLCSGAGGPVPGLLPCLDAAGAADVPVVLTDLYPNRAAFAELEQSSGGRITGWPVSVSAFDLPPELDGFRTVFTGFHHFRPEQAHRILSDAVAKRAGIAVFEAQERALHTVILIPLLVFLAGLLLTPFAGRVSWQRLLFTYLIPICPLAFAWDGFVSCLRTYSPAELRALTRDLESADYHFEIGKRWLRGALRLPLPGDLSVRRAASASGGIAAACPQGRRFSLPQAVRNLHPA